MVDGVRRSLATGFVYTNHDLPEDVIDEAYDKLAEFFSMDQAIKEKFIAPGSHGQTGYTGLLVETAASAEVPDWKEMLNWSDEPPAGHPLRRKYPHRYMDQVLPEAAVPGITDVLMLFHQRIYDLQRRFLRVIAVGLGAHEDLFETMLPNGSTLTRAIRYPPMPEAPVRRGARVGGRARRHQPHHRAPAGHRARAPGEDRRRLGRRRRPRGLGDHQHRDDAGGAVQRRDPARHPSGGRRSRLRAASATASCSSATPPRGRSSRRSRRAARPRHPQRYGAIEAGDKLDEVLYEINLIEDARRVED